MKKNLFRELAFVIVLLLAFGFVACKKENNPTGGSKTGGKTEATTNSYWDADGNGIEDWQEKEVTLKFATWQYTDDTMVTIDVLMAEEFMAKYPNIKIEFVTVGEEYDYDANMMALMEMNELPDVFLIRRLETFLPNNILADITEMYDNDSDTQFIFDSVKNSGVFDGKRYAIPTYIYPQFWVVNKTLLEEKNIPVPDYYWTWEQMENIAKAANDESKHIIGLYGRQGYYGEGATRVYLNELPKILKIKQDEAVGKKWAGWAFDGNRFNFDDPVFQDSMNKLTDALSAGWAKTQISAEDKLAFYNDEEFIPTTGGKVAVWCEASWSFKDQKDNMTFDWDVYPGPSGVTGGNTDIAGVSSLCKNKQAAYQFLKWMSYSEEGILARFNIYKTSGSELYQQGNNYPYPIVDYGIDKNGDNKIWDNIPYSDTAPGLVSSQFLEALRNGAYTMNKEVCGWDAVDYVVGPYLAEIYSGAQTFAALKQSIQEAADTEYSKLVENLKEMLK